MFDEHRKFESCIFCGSTNNLTKEHILGAGLARRFPVLHRWRAGRSLLAPPKRQGTGPITSVAPPVACAECNNERLAPTMNASLESLTRLIRGEPHSITSLDRTMLSRYWQRVGLIIDVMTSNYQITEKYKTTNAAEYQRSEEYRQAPPRYSEALRRAWLAGGSVPDMRVCIGYHSGVLGLDPYTNIVHGQDQWGPTKRFLITIGKLSACISMGTFDRPVPESLRDLAIDNQDWDWPGKVPVSYKDFWGLFQQTPEFKALIQLMRDSERRQKIEEFSKQMGSFAGPPDLRPMFSALVKHHEKLGAKS